MCGICGIVNFDKEGHIDGEILKKMCDVLEHRGPDDEGYFIGTADNGQPAGIGLGIKRLAIIDLETGHQPIRNEDGKIWIVYNGEIYNFPELRAETERKGHKYYTKSDTETIIHLYEDYGANCVKYLRGMFAFGLWDGHKEQLLLARDRLGQKPLVYTVHQGNLIFASEIKSILQYPGLKCQVDMDALHYYLTYQFVPSPLTMFEGINKLPPASTLLCDRKGNIKLQRYWQLNYNNKLKLDEKEYSRRILDLLEESTKMRLISDVPLGAFLSGGLDSSTVVGMMSRLVDKPVKTFSVGFEEKSFTELKYARLVADYFHTEHFEFMVKPNVIEILPRLIWHYNEPFADPSAIPTYYIARETARYVKVALNGDGGDENFAGYDRYKANKLSSYYGKLPEFIREVIIRRLVRNLPESTKRKDLIRRLKQFIQASSFSPERRNAKWHSFFDDDMKQSLYREEMRDRFRNFDTFGYMADITSQSNGEDFLDKILYTDMMTYLPDNLLVKMDIATMANSLETRSPFLDHKLIEFTAQIPAHLKLKGFTSKYILKKALRDLLPREILHRGKMGFGLPIGEWFRQELKGYVREILLHKRCIDRGYFEKETVQQLLEEHISGKVDHGYRLWILLNLELWHQMFIDGDLKFCTD
ncbi:MAG: asparagine synthase (glutamine-hydrolyzing) [Elusimicrobiota bacterium]|nr:asparagine synthase (glutamine-hydrolyzing) [Elusimicrobiota bacterium]